MIRVGQKLLEERLRKGLTLDQVAKTIKIRSSFLSAIEKSEYNRLPQGAYTQGFVKNYAEFLGLSQREILPLFRREFNEGESFRVLPKGFDKTEDIKMQGFKITQTALSVLLIFFILIIYILFQYRYTVISPPLEVFTPSDNQVSQNITVSGKTDPNAIVYVNDSPVALTGDGKFTKHITLFSGKNIIRIIAQNRFGKKTVLERVVNVKEE